MISLFIDDINETVTFHKTQAGPMLRLKVSSPTFHQGGRTTARSTCCTKMGNQTSKYPPERLQGADILELSGRHFIVGPEFDHSVGWQRVGNELLQSYWKSVLKYEGSLDNRKVKMADGKRFLVQNSSLTIWVVAASRPTIGQKPLLFNHPSDWSTTWFAAISVKNLSQGKESWPMLKASMMSALNIVRRNSQMDVLTDSSSDDPEPSPNLPRSHWATASSDSDSLTISLIGEKAETNSMDDIMSLHHQPPSAESIALLLKPLSTQEPKENTPDSFARFEPEVIEDPFGSGLQSVCRGIKCLSHLGDSACLLLATKTMEDMTKTVINHAARSLFSVVGGLPEVVANLRKAFLEWVAEEPEARTSYMLRFDKSLETIIEIFKTLAEPVIARVLRVERYSARHWLNMFRAQRLEHALVCLVNILGNNIVEQYSVRSAKASFATCMASFRLESQEMEKKLRFVDIDNISAYGYFETGGLDADAKDADTVATICGEQSQAGMASDCDILSIAEGITTDSVVSFPQELPYHKENTAPSRKVPSGITHAPTASMPAQPTSLYVVLHCTPAQEGNLFVVRTKVPSKSIEYLSGRNLDDMKRIQILSKVSVSCGSRNSANSNVITITGSACENVWYAQYLINDCKIPCGIESNPDKKTTADQEPPMTECQVDTAKKLRDTQDALRTETPPCNNGSMDDYQFIDCLLYGMNKATIDADSAMQVLGQMPENPVALAMQAMALDPALEASSLSKSQSKSNTLWERALELGLRKQANSGNNFRALALFTVFRSKRGYSSNADLARCLHALREIEHPFAYFALGCSLQVDSGGIDANQETAYFWNLAADHGHADAQYNLGILHLASSENMAGTTADQPPESMAALWLRKAAMQGHQVAQWNLGWMFREGYFVKQSDEEAVHYWTLSARQGNSDAQWDLGLMYKNGVGVKQDDSTAVKFWKLAADQGSMNAQWDLGVMYHLGRGVAEKSEEKAIRYWQLSANKGHPEAQYNLATFYETGNSAVLDQNLEKAAEYYKRAADQGHAESQWSMGWMYSSGQGGVDQDDNQAVYYWELAALQGHTMACQALQMVE